MATILLSAAGAAIGGSIGGSVAGLSSVVIGRAVGATIGRVIDERLLGNGSEPIESGKVDRFRLTNAGDGDPIAQIYGRMRVGGQVIWASQFQETSTRSGGGKGAPSTPETITYSYTVSLAVALCEGVVASVQRVWADGEEIGASELNMRFYRGDREQLPDPLIEAIEGVGETPAFRGTAYVVFEDLPLEPFGNRVPQFSFEVVRQEQSGSSTHDQDLAQIVRGVALVPGTGEYSLATTPVYYSGGPGSQWPANLNSPSGLSDFETSMASLREELPNCDAASMVVCWFGDDLRCGECTLRPKVERQEFESNNMPWSVSGLTRQAAEAIGQLDGRPVYGGTPADAAVVEAIRHMNGQGQRVLFYPFILMDQQVGNTLPDPYSGAPEQPALPWRGRITLSKAPGVAGSPDQTAAADAEVAQFVGTVTAADFVIGDGSVTYTGPDEWSMTRFILHYAALCAAAGGVSAFCIGSEMRGLTQIRGAGGFPGVDALRALAQEARVLLGPDTKISYAADWSEYFGYQPQDGSGDRYFHLDPLWADDAIDFIGIDNYMPLSDWRDGSDHLDARAGWSRIYDLDYLKSNIEGGEGFDWFYHSPEAEAAQIRTPIEDGAFNEPWIWRYKDLRSWWENSHFERIGGVRQPVPTAWEPQSKPFWFTELGCAAIDKGTNQPNKFIDPKSSESHLPKFSNGLRDDLMQLSYLRASLGYWSDGANNPVSTVYGAPMLDLDNAYVWAWDARPYPFFPNNRELWSDGGNYGRGHWLNGRAGSRTLSSVVEEICYRAGLTAIDVSELDGVIHGFAVTDVDTARASLQPLMLRYGFDAIERDGLLRFRLRKGEVDRALSLDDLARSSELEGISELARASEPDLTGRVRLRFIEAGGNHDVVAEEAVLPDEATHAVSTNDLPLAMTRAEGRLVAERWLTESRIARDGLRLALPPSQLALGAGDVLSIRSNPDAPALRYRIDRIEQTELQLADCVRIEPEVYVPGEMAEAVPRLGQVNAPSPVQSLFLDVPLITGDESPHAPHVVASARPWPGTVAVFSSETDTDYGTPQILTNRATIGVTQSPLAGARAGLWDRGEGVDVKLIAGGLEARTRDAVLNGANLIAIGDGTSENWELLQFQDAELIAPDTYRLRNLLRGQLGSNALVPETWPSGSWFVLFDGSPSQLDISANLRGIERHYRIGPARRPVSDPSYQYSVEAFSGVGLRPYSPCHLRSVADVSGNIQFSWIRRARIDGDSWDLPDVPLGEASESYVLRIVQSGAILREVTLSAAQWTYTLSAQSEDGVMPGAEFAVAQVSDRFGPGLFAREEIAL